MQHRITLNVLNDEWEIMHETTFIRLMWPLSTRETESLFTISVKQQIHAHIQVQTGCQKGKAIAAGHL